MGYSVRAGLRCAVYNERSNYVKAIFCEKRRDQALVVSSVEPTFAICKKCQKLRDLKVTS